MSLTIDDVAKAARVSTATVSRVINKNYPVNAKTRLRVEEVISRLGYKPNMFARGLMKAKTDSVGVIVPFISNPYHTQIVNAFEEELSKKDISIYLCCSYDDPALERKYIQRLIHRNVDVLVVIEGHSMNSSRNHYLQVDPHLPIILVNEHLALDTKHHIVRCAQEPGLNQALDHLLSRGRRSIALFRGTTGYSFDLKGRLFKSFVKKNGLDLELNPIVPIRKANQPEAVHEAAACMGELLRRPSPPTAVLAGNDLIAIGALQAALAAGVSVPDDLAIIGVDNTLISQISSPLLSTVDLRMDTIGRITAEVYFELRERGGKAQDPIRRTIDSQLLCRATC